MFVLFFLKSVDSLAFLFDATEWSSSFLLKSASCLFCI